MKKLFVVLALTTAVSLGGCATVQDITSGISLATKSVTNPVTRSQEAKLELAIDTAFQVLLTYRRACLAGHADVNCRQNITVMQPYVRNLKPLVVQLRGFVDNNDQVNAITVYNQLVTLYGNAQQIAASHGITISNLPL